MPNVAELIKDHVTLAVDCVDRLYLNAYVPRLQSSGGVVTFLEHRGGTAIPSPALFGKITETFKRDLRAWAAQEGIPWLEFKRGERKDDVVQPYREHFIANGGSDGVVLVGVAQEKATTWRATKRVRGGAVQCTSPRTTVYVNPYASSYASSFIDRAWGPGFLQGVRRGPVHAAAGPQWPSVGHVAVALWTGRRSRVP